MQRFRLRRELAAEERARVAQVYAVQQVALLVRPAAILSACPGPHKLPLAHMPPTSPPSQAFDKFDAAHDGRLTRRQFKLAMLFLLGFPPHKFEVQRLFPNGDGASGSGSYPAAALP